MAKVPDKAEFTVSVLNGEVSFVIDDKEKLEKIDNDVRRWSKHEVSTTIGMEIIELEVLRK
jgi:hypothetical protein